MLAAAQGNRQTQTNLGSMYAEGCGVPQNLEYAYAWWSVGAAGGACQRLLLNVLEHANVRSRSNPKRQYDWQSDNR